MPLSKRLKYAYHNCIVHPLAGLAWLIGLDALGDWIHGDGKPVGR